MKSKMQLSDTWAIIKLFLTVHKSIELHKLLVLLYQIKRALKTYLVVQEVFAPLVYLSENIYIYI